MIVKLTTPLIRQLTTVTPPNRDERYFDAGLPRFYLRLRPPRTGQPGWASSYGVRYDHNGRERHLRIGSPATMSLEEAREAAKKVLRRVDDGSDPATERAAQRQAWTVDDAVEHYLASPEFARKSDKTRACDAGTLRNHIGYRLGQQKLSELDVPMGGASSAASRPIRGRMHAVAQWAAPVLPANA